MSAGIEFRAPVPVRRAVALMYVGALLSALLTLRLAGSYDSILTAMEQSNATHHGREHLSLSQLQNAAAITHTTLVAVQLVATAVWVLVAVLCYRGRRWARIAATVLGLLGLLLAWGYSTRGHTGALGVILALLEAITGAAAAGLLWHPQASTFFASGAPGRQPRTG